MHKPQGLHRLPEIPRAQVGYPTASLGNAEQFLLAGLISRESGQTRSFLAAASRIVLDRGDDHQERAKEMLVAHVGRVGKVQSAEPQQHLVLERFQARAEYSFPGGDEVVAEHEQPCGATRPARVHHLVGHLGRAQAFPHVVHALSLPPGEDLPDLGHLFRRYLEGVLQPRGQGFDVAQQPTSVTLRNDRHGTHPTRPTPDKELVLVDAYRKREEGLWKALARRTKRGSPSVSL